MLGRAELYAVSDPRRWRQCGAPDALQFPVCQNGLHIGVKRWQDARGAGCCQGVRVIDPGSRFLAECVVAASMIGALYHSVWVRRLAILGIIVLWTGFVIGLPIFLTGRALANGDIILAVVTLLACAMPAFFWWISRSFMWDWLKENFGSEQR
jgi:hypothetical protein